MCYSKLKKNDRSDTRNVCGDGFQTLQPLKHTKHTEAINPPQISFKMFAKCLKHNLTNNIEYITDSVNILLIVFDSLLHSN